MLFHIVMIGYETQKTLTQKFVFMCIEKYA